MIQDIYPHRYHNEYRPCAPRPDSILLFYDEECVLAAMPDEKLQFPQFRHLGANAAAVAENAVYLFSIDDLAYFLTLDRPKLNPQDAEHFSMHPVSIFRTAKPLAQAFAGITGSQIYRWRESRRFCGCCGARMGKSKVERAMVCPSCGNTVYPKICPAVIVAVHDGERLLLTRYKDRPIKHYALVAGFNEIGESIEETVHREVLEETGVRVKNLKFYKSQPWVFTDTLLFGFYAELDGDDHLTVQEDELSEAVWVDRHDVPEDTTGFSLTAEMIEQFRIGAVK